MMNNYSMNKKYLQRKIPALLIFLLLAFPTLPVVGTNLSHNRNTLHQTKKTTAIGTFTSRVNIPTAITVSDSNPFYTLIATPLALHYTSDRQQHVIPLYVKNPNKPSSAVLRAEQQTGLYADFIISDIYTPKEISLYIAATFWEQSPAALIIKDTSEGYNLGMVATPLASYLNMPVIVTDCIDTDVICVLTRLEVEHLFICGSFCFIPPSYTITLFTSVSHITTTTIEVIRDRFDETIGYLTLANPSDVFEPIVLDERMYTFSGTVASGITLPSQAVGALIKDTHAVHEFTIPVGYKYTQLIVDLTNRDSNYVESLSDRMFLMITSPDGERYIYASTAGGIPERDENGNIIKDHVQFQITIYDKPGVYKLQVFGQWFASKTGSYDAIVRVQKINTPRVPLMQGLSSLAPYLTAYHKGLIFAKPDFAFAADDMVLYNGTTCRGVTQPGTNPNLLVPSNQHTLTIHNQLNNLLAEIAEIPACNLQALRNHYAEHPIYIAIAADPTMVPMYFYYNPDGRPDTPSGHTMGFGVPSDFIYGDIDVDPTDPENNTYTYWPFMENAVGRVTGWDVQDMSALLARTFFYNSIIDKKGEWRNNGLVQTGCGLEFQNLPLVTRISHFLYSGRGEPTKFPTMESWFMNNQLKQFMSSGDLQVKNTFWLESQREGFTKTELDLIKKTGILNRLFFPDKLVLRLNSDDLVTGGIDQLNSNLIFTFAHGFYNLYEHGDVFIDSRGFPGVTTFSRIYPKFRSGLSNKGSFDLRAVENMNYGPSVIFVVSCITGRTDGYRGENVLSQAYLHAGVNAYIGATRVTADPGYLEPRPLPGGWGIGLLGLLKATINLKIKRQYPDLHFGALIGGDFILDLIQNNSSTGMALRNAKNMYLPKDANTTFLWSPPLLLSTGNIFDQELFCDLRTKPSQKNSRTPVLDKKYVALHEFTLYGDPAFNPYQPCNEGSS